VITAERVADHTANHRSEIVYKKVLWATDGSALLGGVTQRLLHIAPCPVLAVPPDHNPAD
jgi:hypothetical protein